MKKFLFLLSILGLAAGCSSDEVSSFGNINGIVTDSQTNEPVRGADVVLSPGNLSSTTGADGRYEFRDLEAGQYKLQITAEGYDSNSRQVSVSAGASTTCDVVLSPEVVSVTEDYSGATVLSGDDRISAQIISCKRSGSSVTLTYVLKNEDLESVNDFRIYTTNSISLINGAYRTVITDDEDNNYVSSNYTFNGAASSQSNVLNSTFPSGVSCKGTVTVNDFSSSAKELSVILGIWCYDIHPDTLSDPRIYFKNVPIY